MSGGVLAVDIGGTKIEAAAVTRSGRINTRARRRTEADDAESLFDTVAAACDEALVGQRPEVCGVGCGGPMTARGTTVSPLNIPQWREFPLHARLEEHLGCDVHIDNDAKALALGEGWLGAATGCAHYLAMVVSTGVGGGVVVDGRLVDGAGSNAGHIGHIVVVPDGRRCACGARGCLEAEASGTAIEEMIGAPAKDADREVRQRTGTLVGRAIAAAANLLALRKAVVAGSVALGFGDDFFDAAQAEIDRCCTIGFSRGMSVEPAGLGADGPLVGAAAVGLRGSGTGSGRR